MRKPTVRNVLQTISNFFVFFLTIGFAVSCCMILFLHTMADSTGLVFTSANITAAAKITFINVVLLTVIFATIDYIRRKNNVAVHRLIASRSRCHHCGDVYLIRVGRNGVYKRLRGEHIRHVARVFVAPTATANANDIWFDNGQKRGSILKEYSG